MTDIKPLAGFVIVEQLSGEIATIGKLLAEFGAKVIRLEPEKGLPDRRGCDDTAHQIGFHMHNAGKESALVNNDDGTFERLMQRANAFIYDPFIEGGLSINPEFYRSQYPHLLLVSVSPFGTNTRLKNWKGSAQIYSALSGELSRSGYGMKAPLLPPGELTIGCAAAQAFFAIMTGLYDSMQTGLGRFIDFSLLDGCAQAIDPGFGITGSSAMGATAQVLPRRRPMISSYPIIKCSDGLIRLCILSPKQWEGLREWMGNPEAFMDRSFYNADTRVKSVELKSFISQFFSHKSTDQAVEESKTFRVPCATVRGLVAAIDNEHVKARQSFCNRKITDNLSIPMPNGLVTIDGQRMAVNNIAPDLGSFDFANLPKSSPRTKTHKSTNRARPLEGLRVLDLGIIVVGADTSKLLADLGADVIKIEDRNHLDGSRLSGNMTWSFHLGHRNKKSLGIDLKTTQGHALFLQLAKEADVILSNYKPGTLDRMGLVYEKVALINPDIIMVDSSAFGASGPWSDRMGYGPLVRAETGLTTLWGYKDDHELYGDSTTIYPDHVGARIGAASVLGLLIRRNKSGKGGWATIAQSEIALNHLSTLIACETVGVKPRTVNVPSGIYPARGYDEWVAISVQGNDDFDKLLELIDDSSLKIPLHESHEGRHKNRNKIETSLCRWLQTMPPTDIENCLQTAGIACAHMKRVQDLPGLDYFVDRDFFRIEHNPLLPATEIIAEKQPFISDIPLDVPNVPAPGFAANTREIAAQLLHLDNKKIDELISNSILQINTPNEQ